MLELQAVIEAVKGLLEERFPGEPRYTEILPKGFQRPSSLVESGPVELTDASAECLEVTAGIKVTLFAKVDSYHNSNSAELSRRMMSVLELFAVGYLEVGDRRLHVIGNVGKCGLDYAEVTLSLRYQDDRPGGEEWPLMGEVQTIVEGGISNGTA